MKQMNGLDRMFLAVESDRLPMDLIGIFILDPSTAPDGSHDFERVRAELAARLTRVPLFTNRPLEAPLGRGPELWMTQEFDIDYHLKHVGVPAPRDFNALCRLASSLVNRPMDRDRPLWQAYYVDGFADGSAALLLRLHHASIDGVGGMQMLEALFDREPLPLDPGLHAQPVAAERVPLPAELFIRSVPDQIVNVVKAVQHGVPLAIPLVRGVLSRALGSKPDKPATPKPPGPARSLFNRPTRTTNRAVAGTSLPLADVRAVKDHFGVTLNDVVVAVTHAAVVDYLSARDELPDEPLRIVSPVNIRDESATADDGNHFSFMALSLPSEVGDPVEWLKTVAAATTKARPKRTATSTDPTVRKPTGSVLSNVMALVDTLPGAAWFGVRELVRASVLDRVPPIVNYVVSNIPGPKHKLYLAGAEITDVYGRTMVGAGVGLFVYCISYADKLDVGMTTLAELVPDPSAIADGISHHFAALLAASRKAKRAPKKR